ncbi:MAG: ABC transporter permease [Dehalococcoidia bacterium]|nr:ABC transporter permease [Dehalococcoidia bacterium]
MSLLRSKPAGDDAMPADGPSSHGQHLANMSRYTRRAFFPLITLAAVGLLWEVAVRVSGVAEYLVPTPSAVWSRLSGDLSYFLFHGLITLYESLGGFALGTLVAVIAAGVMAHSRLFERTVYPIALLIKVTPIVAIAPLFVIWFGFGSFPKMMIAALITFFPVMVNTFIGLRSVNPTTLDFFRLLDASEAQVLIKLRIPGALPYVFAAFRIAVPLSVIGAVVGEWFTGDRGLGSVIIVAHHNIDMPTLFSAIAVLACIGLGLTGITALIERRVLFWHDSQQSGPAV